MEKHYSGYEDIVDWKKVVKTNISSKEEINFLEMALVLNNCKNGCFKRSECGEYITVKVVD